jgi:microcystin-dependent protein
MSELLIGGHTAMTQTGTDPVQFAPTIAFPAEAAIPSIVLTPTATAPTAIEGAIYYDSTSDALKIHDGTSWNNIILSGGGSSLVTETFKTISVTGQDDIIAELTEDTLVLSAGANISLTTDATTDTLTITSSYAETDPVFSAHDASNVTSSKITNWDTAHGWGDHSTVGYGGTGTPAGMIAPFAMDTLPTGWLVCDGASISRTLYANLYQAIQLAWGPGDTPGSTFNLPDLRAAFLRGAGASTKFTQDHTTTFATAESDTVQGHYHTANYMYNGQLGTASNLHPSTAGGGAVETATHDNVLGPRSDGTNGTPRIANETRPNNIGVNFCIKY